MQPPAGPERRDRSGVEAIMQSEAPSQLSNLREDPLRLTLAQGLSDEIVAEWRRSCEAEHPSSHQTCGRILSLSPSRRV